MAKYRQAHIPPSGKIRRMIERHVRDIASTELLQFATDLKDELTTGIYQQKFASLKEYPLSPEYAQRKTFKRLDPRVLIATGHYVQSITVIQHGRLTMEVNVPEGAKAVDENGKETDLPLRTLGAIHEYGSSAANIPPRRHWSVIINKGLTQAPKVAATITKKAAKLIRADLDRGFK